MRLLLITDCHQSHGGAEKYFFDLKTRLKKIPGLTVYSLGFGSRKETGDDYIILAKIPSKIGKWLWQIILHPWIFIKIRRQLRKIKPDLIHIHHIRYYSAAIRQAIKHYPIVQTIHDYGTLCPTSYNIHKRDLQPCATGFQKKCFWQHQGKHQWLSYLLLICSFLLFKRWQQKYVKRFFAPSPLLVKYLNANHFAQVHYVPPFVSIKESFSFADMNPTNFLFVGTLDHHKGIQILLKEFALAREKCPQLHLTLVGKGPKKFKWEQEIKELNLQDAIQIVGWQNNLEEFYQRCIAVIFPSIWMEAFGLVITEAMSRARAVIGSNRGSPPWLIKDQQTGFIFDPNKKGDLAEKILELANNPRLAQKLGQNGLNKIREFNNESTLEIILKNYKECINLIAAS